jgi:hypothetical protein
MKTSKPELSTVNFELAKAPAKATLVAESAASPFRLWTQWGNTETLKISVSLCLCVSVALCPP